MQSSKLKVCNLCITEDFYIYKGTFILCCDEKSINVDLGEMNDEVIDTIKSTFQIEEDIEEIRAVIMSKVIEAANIESRSNEY